MLEQMIWEKKAENWNTVSKISFLMTKKFEYLAMKQFEWAEQLSKDLNF